MDEFDDIPEESAEGLQEKSFRCPCCGAAISVLLDPSVPSQSYVEDCEVCCRPLVIRYSFADGELADFDVTPS